MDENTSPDEELVFEQQFMLVFEQQYKSRALTGTHHKKCATKFAVMMPTIIHGKLSGMTVV
jgi:hypothetical protein